MTYPPHVMHFDHLDASEKSFNISQFRSFYPSEEVLRAEMAKCEIVCANCHAERTHQRAARLREARKANR